MNTSFLSREYIVMRLIEIKYEYFHERFATNTEVNLYDIYMQDIFNMKGMNIAILSNNLCERDFNIEDGVIRVADTCTYNLDNLPENICSVLSDESLIESFVTILRNQKANSQKKYIKRKYNNKYI